MPYDGKQWTLSDAERAMIPAHNEETIRLCLSTDEIDFARAADAVRDLYAAAGLPAPLAVVRCSSPMMGAIVWAAATAWHRDHAATYVATAGATYDATRAATDAATLAATIDATRNATDAATDAVDVWRTMLDSAVRTVGLHLAQDVAKLLPQWLGASNGGNEWWQWPSMLAFVRDVVGFRCESHAAFAAYEAAARHGGWRMLHPKFAIVCDRPAERHTYVSAAGQHVLHNESGPSNRWRCGTTVWHIHGFAVSEQIVMRPETLTLDQIHRTVDEDLRGIMLDRYGWPRYLAEIDAECLDLCDNPIEGTKEALVDAPKVGMRRLVATCATGKVVSLGVPLSVKTCAEARRYLSPFPKGRIVGRT